MEKYVRKPWGKQVDGYDVSIRFFDSQVQEPQLSHQVNIRNDKWDYEKDKKNRAITNLSPQWITVRHQQQCRMPKCENIIYPYETVLLLKINEDNKLVFCHSCSMAIELKAKKVKKERKTK